MVWSNPYYPDIKYSVPMGFYAMNTPESLNVNGSIHMDSIDDYIEHSPLSSNVFGKYIEKTLVKN